jgi:hypothetical protein
MIGRIKAQKKKHSIKRKENWKIKLKKQKKR